MKKEPLKSCSLPLTIGVTGHRHIAEESVKVIQNQVEKELLELQEQAGAGTQLFLLTMLAEGADCLVAQTALQLGIRLTVVLPLPEDLYIEDFTDPLVQKQFKKLLVQADTVFSMPVPPEITPEELSMPGETRNDLYEKAGRYIARHSHLLLALWDGKPALGKGGTQEIVRYALGKCGEDKVNDNDLMSFPPARKIVHIPTNRPGDSSAVIVFPRGHEYSKGSDETIWKHLVAQVNKYNHHCHRYSSKLSGIIDQGYSNIKSSSNDAGHKKLNEQFGVCDAMAILFKQKTQRIFLIYFWCLLVSGATLLVFSKGALPAAWNIKLLLPVYLITILTASLAAIYGKKKNLKNNSLDYRILAEGIRVQIFWRMAGIPEDVNNYYLHIQREELQWINFVLNGLNGIISPPGITGNYDDVHKGWVTDQLTYYQKTAKVQEELISRLSRVTRITLGLGMFYVPLRALSSPLYAYLKPYPGIWVAFVCFTVLIGGCLSLWGAINAYITFSGLREQVTQYNSFRRLFSLATDRLEQPCSENNNTTRARRIFFILGREALSENAGWLLLHRPRQMSTPK